MFMGSGSSSKFREDVMDAPVIMLRLSNSCKQAASGTKALQHCVPHDITRSLLASEELELLCSLANEHVQPAHSQTAC